MECLFFFFHSLLVFLACYDGTMCMCNLLCMNGWNYICMYDETYVLDMSYVCCEITLWNISIYVIYICCENCWIKKTEKEPMQALCRLPPTATGSLPSTADGKEATWQLPVLSGSWPIWLLCLQWRTAKPLPTVADDKAFAYSGRRQWITAFAYSGGLQSLGGQWHPTHVIRPTAKVWCSLSSAADGKYCR